MRTESIIAASATVTRITELHPGDVYKRLDSTYNESTLVFGIVTDVMSNGVDGAVVAIEVKKSVYDPQTIREVKVLSTTSDVAIFPAAPMEIKMRFSDLRDEFGRKIEAAQRELDKAREQFDLLDSVLRRVENEHGLILTTPRYETGPQAIEAVTDDAEHDGEA